MVVDTMKKNRIMKITSGSDAIDLVVGVAGRLERNHALADGIRPHAAVGELQLLDLFLRQILVVQRIQHEFLGFVFETTDIDLLAFRHDGAVARNEDGEKVAFLHLDILLFDVGVGHGREHPHQSRIDIHRSGDQEEYKQQESDIGHRAGIDLLYFSLVCCHYLFPII